MLILQLRDGWTDKATYRDARTHSISLLLLSSRSFPPLPPSIPFIPSFPLLPQSLYSLFPFTPSFALLTLHPCCSSSKFVSSESTFFWFPSRMSWKNASQFLSSWVMQRLKKCPSLWRWFQSQWLKRKSAKSSRQWSRRFQTTDPLADNCNPRTDNLNVFSRDQQ